MLTPLHIATVHGHTNAMQLLIDNGADINAITKCGWKHISLHIASYGNNIDAVQLLINNGANINITDACGNTPLHDAVDNGHPNIIQLLIDKGANINAMDNKGYTPLRYADEDTRQLLIDNGAHSNDDSMSFLNVSYPIYRANHDYYSNQNSDTEIYKEGWIYGRDIIYQRL